MSNKLNAEQLMLLCMVHDGYWVSARIGQPVGTVSGTWQLHENEIYPMLTYCSSDEQSWAVDPSQNGQIYELAEDTNVLEHIRGLLDE